MALESCDLPSRQDHDRMLLMMMILSKIVDSAFFVLHVDVVLSGTKTAVLSGTAGVEDPEACKGNCGSAARNK